MEYLNCTNVNITDFVLYIKIRFTTETDALCRCTRKKSLEKLHNEYIRHEIGQQKTLTDRLQQNTLIWYGHDNRMGEGRCPKHLFIGYHLNKK